MTDHWVGLELRHLVALRAIADEGSFKGAARILGYTPSAISQQIATLERIVGVQVIVREHGRKALGPTDAGRILLDHMNAIEARLSAAKSEIDALASGIVGPLRIGTFESVGTRLLPEIIGRFAEEYPLVRVEVEDATLDLELLRSLERGAFDLVFANLPLPPGPFDATVVLNDPWVLVAQVDAARELASTPLTPAAFEKLQLVCFRSARAIDPALSPLRALGADMNVVLQSDYNEVVQGFAAAGLGVALMPLLAVNRQEDRTATIELGDLVPPRQVAIVSHAERERSEAVDAFISIAAVVGARFDELESHAGAPSDSQLRPFVRRDERMQRAS
jgi:DNA-binding transcriptional LysR family regulator